MKLGTPYTKYRRKGTCILTKIYSRSVIIVAGVKCILIMASSTLRQTMIVSLILLLIIVHKQVSNDVWRSSLGSQDTNKKSQGQHGGVDDGESNTNLEYNIRE